MARETCTAMRFALKDSLFDKVKACLRDGLLVRLKDWDNDESVRGYIRHRAERQIARDFAPYGTGDGVLLPPTIRPIVDTASARQNYVDTRLACSSQGALQCLDI
jgi:hypothetical protein